MAAKEVVTIHIGQAGCQVGTSVWELLCREHEIQADGERDPAATLPPEGEQDPFESFFFQTSSGKHVPRTVMLDTDPASRDEILTGDYKALYHPESILAYKQDMKNNFFEGRMTGREYKLRERMMDQIRAKVDMCNNLQGFFVFHSFGGGTGTGIGCDILENLHDQFEKKMVFQPVIYPSKNYSASIVEPYNSILATAECRETVDLTMMLDNEAAYNICKRQLGITNPSFVNLNRIIAQIVSAATTSLRFETELNASMHEIQGNLVPMNPYRYPIISLAPIRMGSRAKHESFTTREIVTELFEPRSALCDTKSKDGAERLNQNRMLAACVLLRGYADPGSDDPSEGGDSASQAASLDSQGKPKRKPIQVKDALKAIEELMNPKGGHRQPLRFLPWLKSGGFKVGVVGRPPVIVGYDPVTEQYDDANAMAYSERQGGCLINTTAVRTMFMGQYIKFLKLFYHKAYIWQFLDAGGEIDTFMKAKEDVRELIDAYEQMLKQCVDQEKHEGDPRATLEGASEERATAAH